MPIYDIVCPDCGYAGELIVTRSQDPLVCPQCGKNNAVKQLSATSSLTGRTPKTYPGPSDHSCCGSTPSQAGCAGPGSCCGKR
jgi:putative FmdB family regulatory protein